jgi:hypothetical protein
MTPRGYAIVHALLWQAGWLAAVLGAARGSAWLGVAAAMPALALHAWRYRRMPAAGLILPAVAVVLGAVVDGALGLAGLAPVGGWPAPWMLALWALVATALTASLAWLRGRPLLAAAFGAVGGPLAYGAGARLGAIAPMGWELLLAVALAWAVALPALCALPDPALRRTAHA